MLGVIAACIPTLGPLLKTYVKPALTRLTQSSDRNKVRGQSVTAVSMFDSKAAIYRKKNYSQIEDESSSGSFDQMNGVELASVTTNIKYEPRSNIVKDKRPVIHVRHDIEAQ